MGVGVVKWSGPSWVLALVGEGGCCDLYVKQHGLIDKVETFPILLSTGCGCYLVPYRSISNLGMGVCVVNWSGPSWVFDLVKGV